MEHNRPQTLIRPMSAISSSKLKEHEQSPAPAQGERRYAVANLAERGNLRLETVSLFIQQQQCPHPTISANATTSPAGAGEKASPCCSCSPLASFFLLPPQARCTTRCGRH